MKKAFIISLIIILSLVGCTSTIPSYRDAIVKNLSIDRYETQTIVKLSLEPLGESKQEIERNKEMKLFLDLLKSGIIYTESIDSSNTNLHLKVSFIDPEPLMKSEYWNSPETPSAEVMAKNNHIYFRTSSENRWVKVDDNFMPDTGSPFQGNILTQDQQIQFKNFIQNQAEKFASQFDYKLRSIQDMGYTTLTTPAGQETVKHLQINLTIDDYIDFLNSFIDNLLQYEHLDELFAELQKVLGETSQDTGATGQNLGEFKQSLYLLRGMLSPYSEKSIEDQLDADIEFLNTNDIYINNQSYIVGGNYHFDWTLKNRAKNDGLKASLNIQKLVWNINKDIQLPQEDLDHAVDLSVLSKDRASVDSLGEDSIIHKIMIEQYFIHRGSIRNDTPDFPYAELDGEEIYLDSPPFEINGTVMVPIYFIGKLTKSDPVWNGQTREVTIQIKDKIIVIKIGSKTILVNGKEVEMPQQATFKNGRAFVPLRSIAENLGIRVTWNPVDKEIHFEYEE